MRTNHYDGDGDSPSWVAENATGSAWTRYITGAEGDLAASQDESGRVTLLLPDLGGDIVATASTDPAALGPTATFESTEFGVPRDGVPRRYGWLGVWRRDVAEAGYAWRITGWRRMSASSAGRLGGRTLSRQAAGGGWGPLAALDEAGFSLAVCWGCSAG